MSKQNVDYGYDVQKYYLEMMLSDSNTFIRCQSIYDATLFDRKIQKTAAYINTYVDDNGVLPTYDMVNSVTGSTLKKPESLVEEHYDWLLAEFETFTRHKGLERAIIQSADLLETGEYGPVEEMIKAAVQVGLTKDLGTDYWDDPKQRLMKLKDRNSILKTGWDSLDSALYGGFSRGGLEIFCGGSGSGKSLILANLGVNWALAGYNVLYVTLELSEELVSMRVDAMVSETPAKLVLKDVDTVDLKVRMAGKKSGAYQIKYLPSGKTVNDIRSYMKEYEIKSGIKVDVLLVDYLDLLMPSNRKISSDNLFVKDKYVSEELRNLSMEKRCVTVSCSQLNRSAVEEVEFDHSHIAGGISKINTADNVIGIFTSKAMRERGRYQLQLMKTRSSSGVGNKVDLNFNVDTLRISNADVENDVEYKSKGTSVLDEIRRKTNAASQPITDVPKVKAEVESSKLRSFLRDLNSEDSDY